MDVPAIIEGVSVREFARKIGGAHVTVLRWLRDGYIALQPDGTIDAAAAEAALASWGLPRHRFEAGGAGGEIRMTLAEAMAAPFTAAAEAAVAAVLRPIDER